MFSLSKSIYRDFLHRKRRIPLLTSRAYLPYQPLEGPFRWSFEWRSWWCRCLPWLFDACSQARPCFLRGSSHESHVYKKIGSCCYGQSHSEWWKLFKSPKTSVTIESLAWNMLVHWLVGSPAWGLNKIYQFYCQFFQSDLPFNPWFEMLWNACDSGLNQTQTKPSSEVLHFRLQLSWSLHLSGELCKGCCIPLKQELVEETTVPVKR